MDSRSICSLKRRAEPTFLKIRRVRGFSLIEVVMVTAIATILFSLGALFTMDSYRGTNFRHEAQTLVTLLHMARTSAMSNVNQRAHGVALTPENHPNAYVLFEGLSYTGSIVVSITERQYGIKLDASGSREVVFEQLSGEVPDDTVIILTDLQRGVSATITINKEGQISW